MLNVAVHDFRSVDLVQPIFCFGEPVALGYFEAADWNPTVNYSSGYVLLANLYYCRRIGFRSKFD